MKTKLVDFLYIFCISASGMSVSLFLKSDIVSLFCVVVTSVVMAIVFSMQPPLDLTKSVSKTLYIAGALSCSSASVFTAVALAGRFVLDKTYVALLVFLSVGVAVIISLSSLYSIKFTTAVISAFALALLLLVILLSVLNKDFTKAKCLDYNVKSVLPLVALSSVDSVFVMHHIKKHNRALGVVAFSLPPAYFLITTIISMSTLSDKLFCAVDMPILKMWQTTYVASFIDRYETLVVTSLVALCLLKSGIMLKAVFEICRKKCWVTVIVLLVVVLTIFSFAVMYALCAIIIASALYLVINTAFKK